MQPIGTDDEEFDASLTHESLVIKELAVNGRWEKHEVLVTEEGYWVTASNDNIGKYEYVTETENGIIYKIRYNNDGSVKDRKEVGTVAPDEGADNN